MLGHATASMTMDLYGDAVDANLWEAAQAIGDILGTSEPPGQQDEDADSVRAEESARGVLGGARLSESNR